MSVINFGTSITLQQFAEAIAAVGRDVTIIGQGEPGIGKSATLSALAGMLPEYETAYIDCTLLDLGDFALPYTEQVGAHKVTKFAPNARFKFHLDRPVIIMLDEIGKAMRSVKNVLLTLMLEKRIGDHYLHPDSIVFGTTNLASDGVGDMLEGHARNRVCVATIAKPDAGFTPEGGIADDGWAQWAVGNGVAPELIAWVKQYPHALASYLDESQKDNPYIWNPAKPGGQAVVTPRSLAKASHIVKARATLGDGLAISLLCGTVGESAARDIQAFLTVVDKLDTWERITSTPEQARVPDDPAARCLLVLNAMMRVDANTLTPWLTYLRRLDKEWQALFTTSVMKSGKQAICVKNRAFVDLARDNQWVI